MIRARTYEEPHERGDHVLFTHPYTSLRMLDPFQILRSAKHEEFAYPDHLILVGPFPTASLGGELRREDPRGFDLDSCEVLASIDPDHVCTCNRLPLRR